MRTIELKVTLSFPGEEAPDPDLAIERLEDFLQSSYHPWPPGQEGQTEWPEVDLIRTTRTLTLGDGTTFQVEDLTHRDAEAMFGEEIDILTDGEGLLPAHIIMLARTPADELTLFADDTMHPYLVRWDPESRSWEKAEDRRGSRRTR